MITLTPVFINYLRNDAYAAALLDEQLSLHIGASKIFRASRSIIAGSDYEVSIIDAVEGCELMLVIIGETWQERLIARRLDLEGDWAFREIVTALKNDKVVIPILLTDAAKLTESSLPLDLDKIARHQYLRFDYRNVGEDSARIVSEIRRAVPTLEQSPWARLIRRARRSQ
jgi:hypothetical protein